MRPSISIARCLVATVIAGATFLARIPQAADTPANECLVGLKDSTGTALSAPVTFVHMAKAAA